MIETLFIRARQFIGLRPLMARNPAWYRQSRFWLRGRTCEACGGKNNLEVHHAFPVEYFPELEMNPDHWVVLCMSPSCKGHINIGHSGNWRTWNPHVRADAALMLKRRQERKTSR